MTAPRTRTRRIAALGGAAALAAATLLAAAPAGADDQLGQLDSGAVLPAGSSIQSPGGQYLLTMATNGNLELAATWLAKPVVLWTSRTAGHPGAHLAISPNGSVFVGTSTKVFFNSKTSSPTDAGDHLNVQNDGNVVIYSATGAPIATTSTGIGQVEGSTLSAGSVLTQGQALVSGNGRYVAVLNSRGQLELFNAGTPYFETHGRAGAQALFLTPSGRAELETEQSALPLWSTSVSGSASAPVLTLQDDGNLVIRASSAAGAPVLWNLFAQPASIGGIGSSTQVGFARAAASFDPAATAVEAMAALAKLGAPASGFTPAPR